MIFAVILNIIGYIINFSEAGKIGTLGLLYSLAVFLPGLAVAIRRLHDTGKSGWMILINLVPLIGFIWFIVLMAKDSAPGENQYGPNPKQAAAPAPTA